MISALLIVLMQLVIVPLTTLRTTFMVKGYKIVSAVIAAIESLIYVLALGMIFADLSNILNMFAYAIGYAGGVYLGCTLENKLAVGYRSFNVNLLERDNELIQNLRKEGFGVTIFEVEGLNGNKRIRLEIISKRSRESELMAFLEREAPKAFVVAFEPTSFKGGYLIRGMKRAHAKKMEVK